MVVHLQINKLEDTVILDSISYPADAKARPLRLILNNYNIKVSIPETSKLSICHRYVIRSHLMVFSIPPLTWPARVWPPGATIVVVALLPWVDQIQFSKVVIKQQTCSSSEVLDHPREVIAVGVAVPDKEDVLVGLVELVTALVRVAQACCPHLTRGPRPGGWVAWVIGARGLAVTPLPDTWVWATMQCCCYCSSSFIVHLRCGCRSGPPWWSTRPCCPLTWCRRWRSGHWGWRGTDTRRHSRWCSPHTIQRSQWCWQGPR